MAKLHKLKLELVANPSHSLDLTLNDFYLYICKFQRISLRKLKHTARVSANLSIKKHRSVKKPLLLNEATLTLIIAVASAPCNPWACTLQTALSFSLPLLLICGGHHAKRIGDTPCDIGRNNKKMLMRKVELSKRKLCLLSYSLTYLLTFANIY